MCFCVSRVCGALCRSRSLHCLLLSPLGVEQPGGVGEGRSSQSVRGAGEWQQPVTEAAPCLEMALCSGWFALSMMDRSRFSICHSATDVRPSSSGPAFLTSSSRRAASIFTRLRKHVSLPGIVHSGAVDSTQGRWWADRVQQSKTWTEKHAGDPSVRLTGRSGTGGVNHGQAGRKTTLQSLA